VRFFIDHRSGTRRTLRPLCRQEHNRRVTLERGRLATLVCLIVGALAANVLADLTSASKAMACCAKTNGACAKLRAPDDCCRQMGHVSGSTAVATASSAGSHLATLTAVDRPVVLNHAASVPSHLAPSKRPYDPPHLHRYNLLI